MVKDLPESPITGVDSVSLVATFAVPDIVRLYREQEGIDVASYFGDANEIYLLECGDTGYRFYFPFETAGDAEFYQLLKRSCEARGLAYERVWEDDHEFGFGHVAEGDHVLEIGFNTGTFLEKLASKTPNAVGLEFNSEALSVARSKGLQVSNETIEDHSAGNAGKYDVVCAFQVFEHLTEIRSFVLSALKCLKPDGKLVLSVPNNEPYYQRFDKYSVLNVPPHHSGLWNLSAFKKMGAILGFTVADQLLYGERGPIVDAYLRAKLLTNVRSLPVSHSIGDKAKMLAAAPFTVALSTFEYAFMGKRNFANLAVALRPI